MLALVVMVVVAVALPAAAAAALMAAPSSNAPLPVRLLSGLLVVMAFDVTILMVDGGGWALCGGRDDDGVLFAKWGGLW